MNAPKPGRAASAGGLPSGVGAALFVTALFGAGTPLAKSLMAGVGPWLLAGLLYLGSGLGLAVLRAVRRAPAARLERAVAVWRGIGRRRRRAGPADVRPGGHASLGRVTSAQCRGGIHCAAGLVRLQGELRPSHRAGHAGDRGRRPRAELARRRAVRQPLACAGGAGRLPVLGHRQQPNPQGVARRRELGGDGEGACRRVGQPGHRAGARGEPAACRLPACWPGRPCWASSPMASA